MKVEFLSEYVAQKAINKCQKISLKERSASYVLILEPPMDCMVYQVDNYIIKGADKEKCDKLIVATADNDDRVSIFVELKGSDVAHAIKQIAATLTYQLFSNNRTKWTKARIVANKIPANAGRSVMERATKNFLRKYNCELRCIKSGNPEVLKQSHLK